MNTDHTHPSDSQDDPVNRWATEHYGFEDDSVDPGSPSAAPSSEPRGAGRRRTKALVAGGVLGLLMASGIGGAALAADGAGAGVGGPALFDGDGRGDGDGGDGDGGDNDGDRRNFR
jgi:hypothetical protein